MAAPAEKTTKNLNGKWSMNKNLSDNTENALYLQGISLFVRKGITLASVTIDVNQYEAPPKAPNTATDTVTHIDIEQTASGLTSTQENRCLDNTERDHADWLFGNVKGRSRWVSLNELDDEYLKGGWEDAADVEGKNYIWSHVESQDNGWTATQIWGFKIVDGERRYVRNVVVTKGTERVEMQLVYDYLP